MHAVDCVIEALIENGVFKIIRVWSSIREVNHTVKKLRSNKWPLFKDEGNKCCTCAFLSENLSKKGSFQTLFRRTLYFD